MERFKFGYTLEELKAGYASGEIKLKEDEFLGDDGLPYCKKCKTKRFWSLDEGRVCMPGACKCMSEAAEKARQEEEARKRMEAFNEQKRLSLMGARYQNIMFANATITEHNRKAYMKAKNYVEKSGEVLANNIGLYIYGDNSSGKTFLMACICNELLWQSERNSCIYTNLATILNEIRASYDGNGMGECAILNHLQYYKFAFIDDLGKEFLGREYNAASSKWAEEKLFEVLNARYNAQKPTIFSSNYSISELASVLGLDKAIVERINEMATRVIKLEGDDFRSIARDEKSEIAKKLGI